MLPPEPSLARVPDALITLDKCSCLKITFEQWASHSRRLGTCSCKLLGWRSEIPGPSPAEMVLGVWAGPLHAQDLAQGSGAGVGRGDHSVSKPSSEQALPSVAAVPATAPSGSAPCPVAMAAPSQAEHMGETGAPPEVTCRKPVHP